MSIYSAIRRDLNELYNETVEVKRVSVIMSTIDTVLNWKCAAVVGAVERALSTSGCWYKHCGEQLTRKKSNENATVRAEVCGLVVGDLNRVDAKILRVKDFYQRLFDLQDGGETWLKYENVPVENVEIACKRDGCRYAYNRGYLLDRKEFAERKRRLGNRVQIGDLYRWEKLFGGEDLRGGGVIGVSCATSDQHIDFL